jgi:hypothetical protein
MPRHSERYGLNIGAHLDGAGTNFQLMTEPAKSHQSLKDLVQSVEAKVTFDQPF